MADIFICYRHDDAPWFAGRLADILSERFPDSHVFRDVEGLEAGVDFTAVIADNLASCAAFLAVIGPNWLAAGDTGHSRLHDPDDFVRLEVGTALARGTFIVPVLVGDAVMPTANSLPEELKALAKRQALEITDRRWDADVDALIKVLSKQPGLRSWRRTLAAFAPRRGWKVAIALVILAVAALVIATRVTQREEPVLPADLRLLDLDIVAGDAARTCIKPVDCDAGGDRNSSEVIRLSDAEIRYDPAAEKLHLLLNVRWTLRQGQTDLFHRGYAGKFHYAGDYQHSAQDGSVVLGSLELQDYSLSPVNGLIAFAFGWMEIPFLVERDSSLATEVRRRLSESAAVQNLP